MRATERRIGELNALSPPSRSSSSSSLPIFTDSLWTITSDHRDQIYARPSTTTTPRREAIKSNGCSADRSRSSRTRSSPPTLSRPVPSRPRSLPLRREEGSARNAEEPRGRVLLVLFGDAIVVWSRRTHPVTSRANYSSGARVRLREHNKLFRVAVT